MNKRNLIYTLISISISTVFIVVFAFKKNNYLQQLKYRISVGVFTVDVIAEGELKASSLISINAPYSEMKKLNVWNTKIVDISKEGSKLDSGDFIALLEQEVIYDEISKIEEQLLNANSSYLQLKLDTMVNLREAREKITDQLYLVEEAKYIVEQSEYEAKSTQIMNEKKLLKNKENLNKAISFYEVSSKQFEIKIKQNLSRIHDLNEKEKQLHELLDKFIIKSPANGILTYVKNVDGSKRMKDARISPNDPVIAEIPNLEKLESSAFIHESEINKIKIGQKVIVEFDAIPEKKVIGEVFFIASMAQTTDNSIGKFFEIGITILNADSMLLPGMTTRNRIIVKEVESALFVPISCIQKSDSSTFVYKYEDGEAIKKAIKIGETNRNFILVTEGLKNGDHIFAGKLTDINE